MKGRRVFDVLLVSMLMVSLAMIGVINAQDPARVFIDPPKSTASPGETIIINVNVDVAGLSSWEVKLSWDADVLYTDYSMISEGDFLSNVGMTYFVVALEPAPPAPSSVAMIGCMLLEPVTASGSGTLATIEFLVKGEGACALDLYETSLFDIDLNPIDHTEEDGYFNNEVIGDLVRHGAWPEHHHFVISKDEDGIQTLYGKVKSLGEGRGYIRVNFTVYEMDGIPIIFTAKYLVNDVETKIAPGEIVDIPIGLWESRDTAWQPGKYYASATCLYSATGDNWKTGEKLKTFSFAIVP